MIIELLPLCYVVSMVYALLREDDLKKAFIKGFKYTAVFFAGMMCFALFTSYII